MQTSHIVGWPKVAVLLVGNKCDLYYGSLLNCLLFPSLACDQPLQHVSSQPSPPIPRHEGPGGSVESHVASWTRHARQGRPLHFHFRDQGTNYCIHSAKLDNFRCLRAVLEMFWAGI